MSPASINLSRRAVACRHWRWEPGMRSEIRTAIRRAAYRWLSGPTDERPWGLVVIVEDHRGWPARTVATLQPGPHDLPDLDDGATLGCLLGLVRLARMDPHWLPSMGEVEGGPVYWIERPSRQRQTWYSSLAEVLVAALEAAP